MAGVKKVRRSEVDRVALPSTVKRDAAGSVTTMVAAAVVFAFLGGVGIFSDLGIILGSALGPPGTT